MKISKCQIVVDAASVHNGDINLAKKMIEEAAWAGADWIKFQSWQVKKLRPDDPDRERFKKAELSDEDHFILIKECKKHKIKFLTTCFDIGRIDFLASLGLDTIKVGSPDVGSFKMIKLLKGKFKRLIVSTGMAYEEEVRKTAEILKGHDFIFLHCVSLYPTPINKVNLARMDWLRQFTPLVGFSDHSLGTEAAKMAIARGADLVEKHFILDRKKARNVYQKIAAEPSEIKDLVDYSNKVATVMGSRDPNLISGEEKSRKLYLGRWGNNR